MVRIINDKILNFTGSYRGWFLFARSTRGDCELLYALAHTHTHTNTTTTTLKRAGMEDVPRVLVGNKKDLDFERQIPTEEGACQPGGLLREWPPIESSFVCHHCSHAAPMLS